jgi:hypothetical protein
MAESPPAKRQDAAGLPNPKRQAAEHNSVVLSSREAEHGYLGRLPADILCEIAKYLYWCMFPSIEFIPLLAPYVGNKHVVTSLPNAVWLNSIAASDYTWTWREYQAVPTGNHMNTNHPAIKMIRAGFPSDLHMLSERDLTKALLMIAARGSIGDMHTAAALVTRISTNSEYLENHSTQIAYSLLRSSATRSDIAFLHVALSLLDKLRSWNPFEVARVASRVCVSNIPMMHHLIKRFPAERTNFLTRVAYSCIKHRTNLSASEFQSTFKDVLEHPKVVYIAHLLSRQHMLGAIAHADVAASVLIHIITRFLTHQSAVAKLFASHIASTSDALRVWHVMLDPKNHVSMGSVLPHVLENALFRESVDLHAACMTFVESSEEDVDCIWHFFNHGVAATSKMFLAAAARNNIRCAGRIFANLEIAHETCNDLFWALVDGHCEKPHILNIIIVSNKLRGPIFDARAREFCASSNNNAAIAIVCKILYQAG